MHDASHSRKNGTSTCTVSPDDGFQEQQLLIKVERNLQHQDGTGYRCGNIKAADFLFQKIWQFQKSKERKNERNGPL